MKKKVFAALLSLCMALSLLPTTTLAASNQVERVKLSGGTKLAANEDYHSDVNYTARTPDLRRWSEIVRSNLTELADGTLMCIRYHESGILAQQFDKSGKFLSEKTIPLELERYGGFYASKDSYYLFFAQTNKEQDDTRETFRLVKYSTDWVRLGQASVSDTRTTVPFRSGSADMAELGGKLYIHTNHEMYASDDGVNHQANITFTVDLASMAVIDKCSRRETQYNGGYVSHSFNQYIATGVDGSLYTADHGDAYPRSMRVVKRDLADLTVGEGRSDFLPFGGEVGEVFTGAQLGGLAVGSTSVITVGTIINQDRSDIGLHNVYLSATKKSDMETPTTVTMLTNYQSKVTTAGNPHLVDLGGDRFMALWNEKPSGSSGKLTYVIDKNAKASTVLCYIILDGAGQQLGEIEKTNAILSDCPPILATGGKVMWYAADGKETTLYTLDVSNILALQPVTPDAGTDAAAVPSATKLTVDGKPVSVDAYAINQNNYIKLRDLAYIINGTGKNFNVTWDGEKNAINLMSKTPYGTVAGDMTPGDGQNKTATLATSKIYVDGVETAMTAYIIGQNNYFKLRDVMQVFDVGVGYENATATLDTGKGY